MWWAITIAALAAAVPGFAACDGVATRVVDRGLHRQWIVERDRAHPERPAKLIEVPWSDAAARSGSCSTVTGSSKGASGRSASGAEVRPGMHVILFRQNGDAEIHLAGVALGAGWAGDVVAVRAGWHGAVLRGVIRGPALVELTTESGGKQ